MTSLSQTYPQCNISQEISSSIMLPMTNSTRLVLSQRDLDCILPIELIVQTVWAGLICAIEKYNRGQNF